MTDVTDHVFWECMTYFVLCFVWDMKHELNVIIYVLIVHLGAMTDQFSVFLTGINLWVEKAFMVIFFNIIFLFLKLLYNYIIYPHFP